MTIHLLGLPHTETTKDISWCAYTQKVRKLATMLTEVGYETILYSGERNTAVCSEHVPLMTREEQRSWWPDYVPERDVFNSFDPSEHGWVTFNERARAAIRKRCQPGDILAITMGTSQKPIAESFPEMFHVEVGIGYSGVWAPYRIFESWAWRNYLTGKYGPTDDVRFYDEVIPNFFEVEDFPLGRGAGDYFLFIGRLTARKGPHVAAEICKKLGARLLVAGQGVASAESGRIACEDGTTLEGDVTYVGVVDAPERAKLMGGAIAVLTPTIYLEPFGGVSVESQLCGTPSIVTPSGGLPENIRQGETGFVCSTLAQFVQAARDAPTLDRNRIRGLAQLTWGTDVIGQRFDDYFQRLGTLLHEGWYAMPTDFAAV